MDKNVHSKNDLVPFIENKSEISEATMSDIVPVQKQTSLDLSMDKNVHSKNDLVPFIENKSEVSEPTMSDFVPVQKQTSLDLSLSRESQKILSVIKEATNFALIGFITFLNILYPDGKGKYSINNLSRLSGMSRTSIRGNLQNLEQLTFITLTENEIHLTERCQGWIKMDIKDKNIHVQNSTCTNQDMLLNVHAQIRTRGETSVDKTVSVNEGTNLDMSKFVPSFTSLNRSSCSKKTTTTTTGEREEGTNSDMSKFVPSWLEKVQLKEQAEELFYIAMSVKANPEAFSMQTLNLYKQMSKERGKDHAAALFLHLLPKAKDNPTGYISSACRQGAEPTSASITQVQEVWEIINILSKKQNLYDIKQQIQNAVTKEDTETVIILTQMQAKIKRALQLLSWTETIEVLIEKQKAFVASLGL
jgi:hypothetical protein